MKILKTDKLNGEIVCPESKTHIHRILFIMLLKKKEGYLKLNYSSFLSGDIKATINVLKALNCSVTYNKETEILHINSVDLKYKDEIIDCNESGTTLRISIIIVLFLFGTGKFTGSNKLMERPLDFYEKLFKNYNIKFELENNILEVQGDMVNIFENEYLNISDCKSSQFITSLMLVAPFYKNNFEFIFLDNQESVSYLKVGQTMLQKFNINYNFIYDNNDNLTKLKLVHNKPKLDDNYDIYNNGEQLIVEIDYSSLAFWLVANKLGANIKFKNEITKMDKRFIHPDQEIISILENEKVEIDLKNCPDLLPILLVWTSLRSGIKTVFTNFERNRLKESNRVEGMVEQLIKLGANIRIYEHKIEVIGVDKLNGGEIDTLNDHRVAMSFAIASLKVDGELIINNPSVVQKSYYNFWKDFDSCS